MTIHELYPLSRGGLEEESIASQETSTPSETEPLLHICEVCGKDYRSPRSLADHRRKLHNIWVKGPYRTQGGKRVPGSLPVPAPKEKQAVVKKASKVVVIPTDRVVNSVLNGVFPSGAIPIEHLPAYIKWRAATDEFLEQLKES